MCVYVCVCVCVCVRARARARACVCVCVCVRARARVILHPRENSNSKLIYLSFSRLLRPTTLYKVCTARTHSNREVITYVLSTEIDSLCNHYDRYSALWIPKSHTPATNEFRTPKEPSVHDLSRIKQLIRST